MTTTKPCYTTTVCNHRHQSPRTAAKCLAGHRKSMEQGGGYGWSTGKVQLTDYLGTHDLDDHDREEVANTLYPL